jgi:hypothetical protein
VTGRPLRIEEISPHQARQELPARTFSNWVADYAPEFSPLLREQ